MLWIEELHTSMEFDRPGGRFSKDPVTCRARKAILETMVRLPWKAALLVCFRYKERQNKWQVSMFETSSYWRYKGIYVTRKVSGRSRNGLPVSGVQRRTVGNSRRVNISSRHLTLKMTSAQDFETSVSANSPSWDSFNPDDQIPSRLLR